MPAIKFPQTRKNSSAETRDHVLISNHRNSIGSAIKVFDDNYAQQFCVDQKKGDTSNKTKPRKLKHFYLTSTSVAEIRVFIWEGGSGPQFSNK